MTFLSATQNQGRDPESIMSSVKQCDRNYCVTVVRFRPVLYTIFMNAARDHGFGSAIFLNVRPDAH
jgi:hypothetical protein